MNGGGAGVKLPFKGKLPVFWMHFLAMCCVLVMATIALMISNQVSVDSLTREYMSEVQNNLDRNSEKLSDMMYQAYAIPSVIESSKYYEELRFITGGELPAEYTSLLPYITEALGQQAYLSRDRMEQLVYLSGVNSICSTNNSFIEAENCFRVHLRYSETPAEEILRSLRMRSTTAILPMQQISSAARGSFRGLTVIIRTADSPVGVLSVYKEEDILDYLDIYHLPEGTYLRITDMNGNAVMEYPAVADEAVQRNCYELRSALPEFRANVTVWVPEDCVGPLLEQPKMVGFALIAMTLIIGIILSLWLSDASTRQLRQMVSAHTVPERAEKRGFRMLNEVDYLEKVLRQSRQETDLLQTTLRTSLLSRAFSGAPLSEADGEQLRTLIPGVETAYRVALIKTSREVNQVLKADLLQECLSSEFYCELLSETSSGILFPADEEHVLELTRTMEMLVENLAAIGQTLQCGISGPLETLNDFRLATHQAHLALQSDNTIGVFAGGIPVPTGISWLQHERLYQSILDNDWEGAENLLRIIAANIGAGGTAQENFYNVRFVLRSARKDLGLMHWEEDLPEYSPRLLPGENMDKLKHAMEQLFQQLLEQQSSAQNNETDQLLVYIRENCANPNLCALSAATHFGFTEKNVYTMVRQATGMSFREYLVSIRMQKAAALLCGTKENILDIAQKCGYLSESTFYRVFRQYYNATPNHYRKMGGSSDE